MEIGKQINKSDKNTKKKLKVTIGWVGYDRLD